MGNNSQANNTPLDIYTAYESRVEAYSSVFNGIKVTQFFQKYYLTLYVLTEKLERIKNDARDQAIFDKEREKTEADKKIIEDALNADQYNNDHYKKLKAYLDKKLAEKTAHRNFLLSRFGKFCAGAFAVGNGLGLAMVGYMITNGLGETALMITGLVVGHIVIVGLMGALFYFAEEKNKNIKSKEDENKKMGYYTYTSIGLFFITMVSNLLAYEFKAFPEYGLVLLIGSLAFGAFFTVWANFDVTRDNNHKFLMNRLDQHNHETDVPYTFTQKLALFIAAGMVLAASLVGGYFAYAMVLELFTETSLKNFFAYDTALSFSAILGIGSFFTIGIVFYEFAKRKILSASNFGYLIHLKSLILANDVAQDNTKSGIEKAIRDAKNTDVYRNSEYKSFRNYAVLFGVFALPLIVIIGAIFQQFAIIDLLAESLREGLFTSELAMSSSVKPLAESLCIVAGLSYVFMFVPAAIGTVIKLAYGIPRIGGYDELTPEAKTRFQLKRAGNTVMNALEATLGAALVFNSITAIVFITVFAALTSFVMSDIEGDRDRVTDKFATAQDDLYRSEVELKGVPKADVPFTFDNPRGRVTYGYNALLAESFDGAERVNEKGAVTGVKVELGNSFKAATL